MAFQSLTSTAKPPGSHYPSRPVQLVVADKMQMGTSRLEALILFPPWKRRHVSPKRKHDQVTTSDKRARVFLVPQERGQKQVTQADGRDMLVLGTHACTMSRRLDPLLRHGPRTGQTVFFAGAVRKSRRTRRFIHLASRTNDGTEN